RGTVGDGPAGAADVDFYALTLTAPSHGNLRVSGDGSTASLKSILTLYGSDPTTALKVRVVTQDDGSTHGGDAALDQDLGAGTWYVAVSGAGNRSFNPFLASSGYDRDTRPYTLTPNATSLGLTASGRPARLGRPAPPRRRPGVGCRRVRLSPGSASRLQSSARQWDVRGRIDRAAHLQCRRHIRRSGRHPGRARLGEVRPRHQRIAAHPRK